MSVQRDLSDTAPWLGLSALVAFATVGAVTRLPPDPALSIPAAAVVLAAGSLMVRLRPRRAPSLGLLVGLATAGVVAIGGGRSSDLGWFAVCILAVWTQLAGGRRIGAAYWIASIGLFAGEWVWTNPDPGWGAWIAGVSFSAGAAALVTHERLLLSELRAAQAGQAERTRVQERARIARELHDVIAHCLTVSLLHISSARLAIEHDPPDAARSLVEAERLARESLDEVRSIMGLLRAADDSATAPPVPGISSIPELVQRFRAAGVNIDLHLQDQLERLPATTGATAYRILQEALTNTVKHAHSAPVTVSLSDHGDQLELVVHSAGPPGHGQGMGLSTMAERAQALGGSCQAEPSRGGWQVRAYLPATPPRSDGAGPATTAPGPIPRTRSG
jgi:signal transduction histidine kinase